MAKAALDIEINGIKETFDKIKSDFSKISNEIDMELGDGVQKIVSEAKTKVPANFSRLATSLYFTKLGKFNYRFGSNVNYAAYVEFGTGKFAAEYVPSIDPEWQKYAKTFQTSRPGKLPSSPYLYPSYIIGFKNILNNINIILKKYA
jgi:hypothetical protein